MLSSFLDWFEEHKVGVVGTLTVHSGILFVCTLLSMRATPTEAEISDLRVDVMDEVTAEQVVQQIINPELAANQHVTNLTSNITAQVKPYFSQTKLAERVESELHEMERAEFEKLEQERRDRGETDPVMPELDPSKWNKDRYMDKAAEPVRIEGATTVWHDLKDRVRAEGIPGYLCQKQGRVAVRVTVDRSGSVDKAELDPGQSFNVDDCMLEQAVRSAKQTRFNGSGQAPAKQVGTVYFMFLPQ